MGVDDIKGGASNNVSQEAKTVSSSIKKSSTKSTSITQEQIAVRKSETVKTKEKEDASNISQSQSEVREQLKEWTSKMNVAINEKVNFDYSEDFGGIYVTVVDNVTNEVIRKIPTEDAIKLSAIWKEAVGNIFDHKG